MNFTDCEKTVLEDVYLNQPAVDDVVQSSLSFAEMFGRNFREHEILSTIDSLVERRLIVRVSSRHADRILDWLATSKVHGPLIEIGNEEHFSVTPLGGQVWLEHIDRGGDVASYNYSVADHIQLFTPSPELATHLSTEFDCPQPISVCACLAPNTGARQGFLLDVMATPDAARLILRLRQHQSSLLVQFAEKNRDRIADVNELCELINLSGYYGPSGIASFGKPTSSAVQKGLARRLRPNDASLIEARMVADEEFIFGSAPRGGMTTLTDAGEEALVETLQSVPEILDFLLAAQFQGEYIHSYSPTLRHATECQETLRSEGISATQIERIGSWCDYWWSVRSNGFKFSYWQTEER